MPSASLQMIKSGGVLYTPEGCADIQQDLDRLEKWSERDLMKLSKHGAKSSPGEE